MRDWLKNLVTPKQAPVPTPWAELALDRLQAMENVASGGTRTDAPERTLEFVLKGGSVNLFDELRDPKRRGKLWLFRYGAREPETGLYEKFGDLPLDVATRWAFAIEQIWLAAPHAYPLYFDLPVKIQWAEMLLMHASATHPTSWPHGTAQPLAIHAVERLLIAAEAEPSALLAAAFVTTAQGRADRLSLVAESPDYADALHRHIESLRAHLVPSATLQRTHVLAMLVKAEQRTLDLIPVELVKLASAGAKQVRVPADALIARCGDAIVAPLKQTAVDGTPDQRLHALRLLQAHAQRSADSSLIEFAVATARADTSATVQAALAEWETTSAEAGTVTDLPAYELPQIDWSQSFPPEAEAILLQLQKAHNELVAVENRKRRAANEHHEKVGYDARRPLLDEFGTETLDALRGILKDPGLPVGVNAAGFKLRDYMLDPMYAELGARPGMTPAMLFKICLFRGSLTGGVANQLWHPAPRAFNTLHARTGRPTLLELGLMLEAVCGDGSALLHNYCATGRSSLAVRWADDAVWPFFAHYRARLAELLRSVDAPSYYFQRPLLFKAIATMPVPPVELVNPLFDLALGTQKTERLPAQDALAKLPGKQSRIETALRDGRAEVRSIAAQWLGRIGNTSAILPLATAFAAEKNDTAKGALLDALQSLGEPVEKYLDRKSLLAEAKRSASKSLPKELGWVPWESMPVVHWAADHELVAPELLRWMLSLAHRTKSPEPNALLRNYAALFEPEEREDFGQWVLESWLREDVRPIDPADARVRAAAHAVSMQRWMLNDPASFAGNPLVNKSLPELELYYLPAFLRQPVGSAIGSKGILAMAAACAGGRAAAPCARYIKEWFGTRAAQGKALIAMLGWIGHPSATQLMLAIGNRFRTRSFQEEATRQAQLLAERRGWTLPELADRTIPSAGFEDDGTLPLYFGTRTFIAKLLPDFKIELFNPEGRKIASLPEARQDDDADLAKESRKLLSAARKEIKSIVELQTDRLYEALCTGRDWPFAEFREYLQGHPVVRHLVQRLVWVASREGQTLASFRPLDDGSLTDCDDQALTLLDTDRVRIAHDSMLDAKLIPRWQQHLVDYEIQPLYQQLGKGTYTLTADRQTAAVIDDFKGHMLEAFALRGRASKLGYARGAAQDAGWFYHYEKRFPTLGLTAILGFSGNGLPEENRSVALTELSFETARKGEDESESIPLAALPAILLSECYNDLRLIAAEGTGPDPEWESKTG